MLVRKFTLVNAKGDRMPLANHNEKGMFGINPKGLGIGFNINSDDFQTSKVITSIRTTIPVFEIDVTFGLNYAPKSPRELVFDLVRFLDATPYVLEYTNDNGTYSKDCILSEFPMTDLEEGVTITQTLKFTVTSLWYQIEVTNGVDNPGAIPRNVGKIFYEPDTASVPSPNIGRAFPYTYSDMERQPGEGGLYDIYNDSVYMGTASQSPITIEINQPIATSFGWDLLVDSKIVATDFYKTSNNSDIIHVASGDGLNKAVLLDRNTREVKSSLYGFQDHSVSTFIMAPLGLSTIRFRGLYKGIKIMLRKEFVVVG